MANPTAGEKEGNYLINAFAFSSPYSFSPRALLMSSVANKKRRTKWRKTCCNIVNQVAYNRPVLPS
jgi:hypothetical protein